MRVIIAGSINLVVGPVVKYKCGRKVHRQTTATVFVSMKIYQNNR